MYGPIHPCKPTLSWWSWFWRFNFCMPDAFLLCCDGQMTAGRTPSYDQQNSVCCDLQQKMGGRVSASSQAQNMRFCIAMLGVMGGCASDLAREANIKPKVPRDPTVHTSR